MCFPDSFFNSQFSILNFRPPPFFDPSSIPLRSFFETLTTSTKSPFYLNQTKPTENQLDSPPRQPSPFERGAAIAAGYVRIPHNPHPNFQFSPFNSQFFSSPLSNPFPTLPIPIPNAPSPPCTVTVQRGGLISAFRSFLSDEKSVYGSFGSVNGEDTGFQSRCVCRHVAAWRWWCGRRRRRCTRPCTTPPRRRQPPRGSPR